MDALKRTENSHKGRDLLVARCRTICLLLIEALDKYQTMRLMKKDGNSQGVPETDRWQQVVMARNKLEEERVAREQQEIRQREEKFRLRKEMLAKKEEVVP